MHDGIAAIPPHAPHPYLHPASVLISRHPVYLIHNDSMTSSSALPRPLVGEGSDGRVAELGGHHLCEPSFTASVTRIQLSVVITGLLRGGEGVDQSHCAQLPWLPLTHLTCQCGCSGLAHPRRAGEQSSLEVRPITTPRACKQWRSGGAWRGCAPEETRTLSASAGTHPIPMWASSVHLPLTQAHGSSPSRAATEVVCWHSCADLVVR